MNLKGYAYLNLMFMQADGQLALKELNSDWSDTSYLDEEYFFESFDLKSKSLTVSGFSSGALLTTNMFAWFNQRIDSIAVLAGTGPCTTRQELGGTLADYGWFCEGPGVSYPTDGYNGKSVFFFTGDYDPDIDSKKSAEWHKSMGMNVKTHWKSGFNHTFANDIPGHEDFNPKIDCANISLAMDPLP